MWTKCASFLPICLVFFISAKFMRDTTTVICEPFTLVFFTSIFRYINEVLYLNEPINSATNNSFIHVFLKLTAQRITAGTSHTYIQLFVNRDNKWSFRSKHNDKRNNIPVYCVEMSQVPKLCNRKLQLSNKIFVSDISAT